MRCLVAICLTSLCLITNAAEPDKESSRYIDEVKLQTDLKSFYFYNPLEEEAVNIEGTALLMAEGSVKFTQRLANLSASYALSLDAQDAPTASNREARSVKFFETSVRPLSMLGNEHWRVSYKDIDIQTYFVFDGTYHSAGSQYLVMANGNAEVRSFDRGEAGVFHYDVQELAIDYNFGFSDAPRNWLAGYRYVQETSPLLFNHTDSGSASDSEGPDFEIRFDEEITSHMLYMGYENQSSEQGWSFDEFRYAYALSVSSDTDYEEQSPNGGRIANMSALDISLRYIASPKIKWRFYAYNRLNYHENDNSGDASSDQWFTEYGVQFHYRFSPDF